MQSKLFTVTGFVCLFIALIFGLFNRVRVGSVVGGGGDAWAPNITNAGVSCGFAIAGGLCFIAAAICMSVASRPQATQL